MLRSSAGSVNSELRTEGGPEEDCLVILTLAVNMAGLQLLGSFGIPRWDQGW